MTVRLSNSKYFLAMIFLGALLGGCHRNTDTGQSPSAGGAPATPPPAASPAPQTPPAPAPDTSSAAPPPSGAPSSAAPGTAQSAGEAVDDTVITGKVKAAFLADSNVKGSDISVETHQGDVTLSGAVASQAQIDDAVRIARGIDGVKNVENKLTVKG
jgi:hyperosmotically inducible protein